MLKLFLFIAVTIMVFLGEAGICEEQKIDSLDTEISQRIEIQKAINIKDKELELAEKEAKITELKMKAKENLEKIEGRDTGITTTVTSISSLTSSTLLERDIEIAMIIITKDEKKAYLRVKGEGSAVVKIGDEIPGGGNVIDIDKDSVAIRNEEIIKRYRINVF